MDHSEDFIRFKPQRQINKVTLDRGFLHNPPGPLLNVVKTSRQNKYIIAQHQTQRDARGSMSKLTLGLASHPDSFNNQCTRAKDIMVVPKLNYTTVGPKPSHSGRPTPRDDLSKPKKKTITRDIVSNNSSVNQRLHPHKTSIEDANESTETISPCLKLSTVFAEIIIMISGIAMIILGLCLLADKSFSIKLIRNALYMRLVYVLIGIGCSVVLVAVIGVVGAVKESKWLMKLNALILVLVIFGLLIGGQVTLIYLDSVRRYMAEGMLKLTGSYSTDSAVKEAWDMTQQNLHCCGVFSSADWLNDTIPNSCCSDNNCVTNKIYPTGCYEETVVFIEGHIVLISGFYVGACFVVLNGVGTSCAFQKSLSTLRP